ncbi:MAG: EamA family transporter [Saprospiraceae bacterium]|nr:EamA family transporter [Saprospiraceae bacterium]
MLQDKRDIWLVPLCIFIVYIVWGTTYLGNAWGVKVIPPFMFSGIRFLVAGSVLLLISSFFSPIEITWKQFKNLAFAGLLLFGVGNGLVTWALQYVDSGITALVISLEPLVVALMLWGYKKQKPQNNTWIGIGLGIFGMALLVGQPRFVSSWEWIIGFSFIFMAMLAWGYISIWIASADLPKSVFQSASLQMILGGLMLLASSFGLQEIQNFDWSTLTIKAVGSWIYLMVFGSICAFSAFNYLLLKVSPTRVVASSYVHPVIAIFLGWWLNKEGISEQSMLAAGILLTGVIFINQDKSHA